MNIMPIFGESYKLKGKVLIKGKYTKIISLFPLFIAHYGFIFLNVL
jgi:hypothetical protein